MSAVTVLITGCGGHFMRDTLRCYRNNGEIELRLIGTASELDLSIASELDEYIKVPRSVEPGYLHKILELCRDKGVDIVVPNVDEEILSFCTNRQKFAAIGTVLSAPDFEAASQAMDKLEFMNFLKRSGLPHPAYASFNSADGFVEAEKLLGYPERPICIKLRDRAGSVGFRIIDSGVDMLDVFMNSKPTSRYTTHNAVIDMLKGREDIPVMLAQEYLPGKEYSVDMLADRGRVLYMVGRENTVCENSIPMDSTVMYNAEAYEISERVASGLGLDGNIGIDFIFNSELRPIPIEVNTRITSTISLSTAAGVNLAFLQIRRLLCLEMPELEPEYGVRVVRAREAHYMRKDGIPWQM